jgi:alpha-L-rhamnosidase
MPGWSAPGFNDDAWQVAVLLPPPKAVLAGCRSQPVHRQEELPTQALTEPQFGVHVFDLGQNMVGWARIKVRAPAGRRVTIRYAEMLNTDGTLYTANLRSAQCTDRYICKGGGEEIYEPHFTFHGFRYVELTGLVEKPLPADVTGIVLHSDVPATGTFECSEPLVNRLQQNILWGQKGNFLEVPTDCPQRDERLGWTGDAQVFARTACFNRDVAAFFTKWCLDLADAQYADGAFPHVAPDVLNDGGCGCAAWADAGVICPWTVYLCYGDTRILERQYSSMTRWIAWRLKRNPDLISTDACFGDWLAIDIPVGNPGGSPTPRDLIATAYFAHTTKIVAQTAAIIGRQADARKYAALARRIKAVFNREFVSPNGRLAGDTQTAYLLALGFGLLAGKQQAHAVRRLVKDIEDRGVHLSTGFVGAPLLAPVLSRFGHTELAYKLLLQTTYPSWLYTVLQGATTMWERWNSYTKAKGFGDASMNSFNHYAYGAIGEWLYNTVAGIELDPAQPGYKHIIFRPRPGGDLSFARAELLTRYGKAACAWKLDNGKLAVTVTAPPNTSATVLLPGRKPRHIGAGTYEFGVVLKTAG